MATPYQKYTITGRNGVVYTVEALTGTSKQAIEAEVLRRAPEAGRSQTGMPEAFAEGQGQRPRAPNRVRQVAAAASPFLGIPGRVASDFLGAPDEVRDIQASFVGGANSLAGAVSAGVSGADSSATRMFNRQGERLRGLRSDAGLAAAERGATRRAAAEGTGFISEVGAGIRSIADDPTGMLGGGAGSLVAVAPAAIGALYGGVPAAAGLGTTMLLGGAAGAGSVRQSIYSAVQNELVALGMPEAEANDVAKEAQQFSGDNTGSIALGGILGLIASRTGLEGAALKAIGQKIGTNIAAKATGQTAKRTWQRAAGNIAKTAGSEFATEAAQGGQERLAANLALRNTGFDTDTFRGVAGAAATEGTVGAILGGVTARAVNGMAPLAGASTPPADPTTTPAATPPTPVTSAPLGATPDIVTRLSILAPNQRAVFDAEYNQLVEGGLTSEELSVATALQAAERVPPVEKKTRRGRAKDVVSDGQLSGAGVSSPDVRGELGGTPAGTEGTSTGDVGVSGGAPTVGVQGESNVDPALVEEPVVRPRVRKAAAPAAAVEPAIEGENLAATAAAELAAPVAQTPSTPTVEAERVSPAEPARLSIPEASAAVVPVEYPKNPNRQSVFEVGYKSALSGVALPEDVVAGFGKDRFAFNAGINNGLAALPGMLAAKSQTAPAAEIAPAPPTPNVATAAPQLPAPPDLAAQMRAIEDAVKNTLPEGPDQNAFLVGASARLFDGDKGVAEAVRGAAPELRPLVQQGAEFASQVPAVSPAPEVTPVAEATNSEIVKAGLEEGRATVGPKLLPAFRQGLFEVLGQKQVRAAVDPKKQTPAWNDAYTAGQDYAAARRGTQAPAAPVSPAPEVAPAAKVKVKPAAQVREETTANLAAENRTTIDELEAGGADVATLRSFLDTPSPSVSPVVLKQLVAKERAKFAAAQKLQADADAEFEAGAKVRREKAAPLTPEAALQAYDADELKLADLTPPQRAAWDTRNDERTFQELRQSEPDVTREEFERRKTAGMQQLRSFLEVDEKLQAADKVTRRQALAGLGSAVVAAGAPAPARAAVGGSLADAVKTGDANKVLAWLTTSASTKEFRALASRMVDSGGVGNTTINTDLRRRGARGTFNPATGVISMRPDEAASQDVLLHELLHAFLGARYNTLSTALEANRALYGLTPAQAQAAINEFNDLYVKVSGLLGTDPVLAPLVGSLVGRPNTDATVEAQQMWSNPDEFFAWALTDPDARALLQSIDADGKPILDGGKNLKQRKPSMWDRFTDWARRLMGMPPATRTMLDVTLASADTVLRHAKLDRPDYAAAKARIAYRRGRGTPLSAKSKTPAAPADPAATKALKNTRVVVTEAQKNFSATNTIENPSAAANNNWLAGNINNFMPWLKANLATLDNRTLNKWLRVMPLSSMAEWGEKNVPGMMELYNLGTKKIGQLHIYQRRFNEITKQLVALANKDGQKVIAKLAYFARIDRVDVTELGDTLDASYKADKPLQWIEAELAKQPLDKARRKELDGDRTYRRKEVEQVYELWQQLGEQRGGREAFLATQKFYKTMYNSLRALNYSAMRRLNVSEDTQKKLQDAVDRAMDGEPEETGGVPRNLYPREYTPAKRFGEHWLDIAADTSKGNKRERIFATFDTAGERDAELQRLAEKYKLDADTGTDTDGTRVISQGDSMKALQKNLDIRGTMLKQLFDTLDAVTKTGADLPDSTQVAALKDELFRTWLMSSSANSLQKNFLKTEKLVAGQSMDLRRVFSDSAMQYASLLASAEYDHKVQNQIEKLRDDIDEQYTPAEQSRYRMFVDEMENRLVQDYAAENGPNMFNSLNRAMFFYFLTAPATAAAQWVQLPSVVLPFLGAEYGYGKASAAFTRYLNFAKTVGVTETNALGEKVLSTASMRNSELLKNDPLRRKAYNAGSQRAAFETMVDVITSSAATPAKPATKLLAKTDAAVTGTLSAVYTAAELITREIAFMTAFDLHYAKTGNFEASVDAAMANTNKTMGSYLDIERPTFMKYAPVRSITAFKQYSIAMTKLYMDLVAKIATSKGERVTAAKQLAGITAMGALLGGVPGTMVFGLIGSTFGAAMKAVLDDEEKEAIRADDPLINPLDSFEDWFRRKWLPDTFGTGLGDIVENGVISELTGADFASRLSNSNLWFRDGKSGETPGQNVLSFAAANIPPLSMAMSVADATKDFSEGKLLRGTAKVVPAFLRGGVNAIRLQREGVESPTTGDTSIRADEINFADVVSQTLGFVPMKVSDFRKESFAFQGARTEAGKAKSRVMGNLYRVLVDENAQPGQLDRAIAAIERHNLRYPPGTPYFIDEKTLMTSLERQESSDERTYRGMMLSDEEQRLAPIYEADR